MPIDDSELDNLAGARLHMPVAPVCPQCSYNLTGLIDPQCPECGHRFNWVAVRRKARVEWLEALGLKTFPDDVEFGWKITWIGWATWLLVVGSLVLIPRLSLPSFLSYSLYVLFIVLHLVELLMAFCGVFLCGHIVKFRRLSPEAREALRIEVPVTRAWIGLVASTVLLLISLPMCLEIVAG